MVAPSEMAPTTSTPKKLSDLPRPPEGYLTRIQAQDLAGVSHMALMEWERKGMLHPIKARSRTSNHGCFYYNAAELAEIAGIRRGKLAITPGEIAGRVFELLRAGKAIDEIVVELRLEPAAIEDLRQQWLESVGKALVVPERNRIELEQLLACEVRNADDLIARVRALVSLPAPVDGEVP